MNNDLKKLKEVIEKNYGKVSDRALDLLASYNYENKLLNAINSKGDFEQLPESALGCDWRPYYCDDCECWHECYVGWGVAVDSEGIYGVISSYSCEDWDNEYLDLTHEGNEEEYFNSIEENYEFNEKSYLHWVLENKDDPLHQLSIGIGSNRINCSINLSFKKSDGDVKLIGFTVAPPEGKEMSHEMWLIFDRLKASPEYFHKLLWSDFNLKGDVDSKNVIDHFEISAESLAWLKEKMKEGEETFNLDGSWDLPEDICQDILLTKAKEALKSLGG